MKIIESLALDDVLLLPKFSKVRSRSEVSLAVDLGKGFKFSTPFIPANMRDIAGIEMAKLFLKNKSLFLFHRFAPMNEQIEWIKDLVSLENWNQYIGFSIGIKDEDYLNVEEFVKRGVKILCLDIAHANSDAAIKMVKHISKKHPSVLLIAGNVAEENGAENLWLAGADVVKVGIGAGSICTTRINTGNGVPTITALDFVARGRRSVRPEFSKENRKISFIADGGIRNPGDASKCLCFADMIMAGNIFAATEEANGKTLEINGKKYKSYSGSSTHKERNKEGVEAIKEWKGSAQEVIDKLSDGVRSCCSYQGVYNTEDLKLNPFWIKTTRAGQVESAAHDLDAVIG